MNKKWQKICLSIIIVLGLCMALYVLNRPAKNSMKTTTYLPEITNTPVYVPIEKERPVRISMEMQETMYVSALQLLIVNINESSVGGLEIKVEDDNGNTLASENFQVNSIKAGEWFALTGINTELEKGRTYQITASADESNPYFMLLEKADAANLPFKQEVFVDKEQVEGAVSIGLDQATPEMVRFGEILYFSVPFCIIAAIVALLFVWIGKGRLSGLCSRFPALYISRWGSDIILLLVFVYIAAGVLVNGYNKGVYITSDSAGYLREAVNLAKGKGFAYDGLAGYDSWFANWPILYPAMIAAVMVVTGTEAYLASKILTIIFVAAFCILLRVMFGRDAWFYSLTMLNLGFLSLTYYTWSEIPFMFVLLLFAVTLGKIVKEDRPQTRTYIACGILGFLVFLTRYFGIYVWIAVGGYLLWLLKIYLAKREQTVLEKCLKLACTAFASGTAAILYLTVNKIMNGNASGVSRTLWWDDYEKLTNDLVDSLWTEICNVFMIQIPDGIAALSYPGRVLLFGVVLWGIGYLVYRLGIRDGIKKDRISNLVWIYMGISYYLIFIVIRYFSSMDTFYFRFFEPASFIISMGVAGLMYPHIKTKAYTGYLALYMTAFLLMGIGLMIDTKSLAVEKAYFNVLTEDWEEEYKEIPQNSVIIFNDIDFRSSFYRPDVVNGEIRPGQTLEELSGIYYGSGQMCISVDNATIMVNEGDYEVSVKSAMMNELAGAKEGQRYIVIPLNSGE